MEWLLRFCSDRWDAKRCLFNVQLASSFNVNIILMLKITSGTLSHLAQLISRRKFRGRA